MTRRVAATHRYFWPQNYPYADMLRELVEAMSADGDDVTVLSARPVDDAEARRRDAWAQRHGVTVDAVDTGDVRATGRARKVASHVRYVTWLARHLLRLRPDLTWVASTPPVLAGLVVRWTSRLTGGDYVYHVQDVHPEALTVQQDRPALAPLFRWARAVDRRTVEAARATIVLSQDMRETLVARGVDDRAAIHVIDNFVAVPRAPEPLAPITADGPFRLLFAGGIGPFQKLDQVLAAVARLSPDEGIVVDIMGDGPERHRLERAHGNLPHVHFLGQRPRMEAHAAMCRASAGIVSLLDGITRVAHPSKVIDYRAFGLPMWAMIDPDSWLARDLRERGDGWVPSSRDPDQVADGLRAFRDRLVADPPDRDAQAARAREAVSAASVVPQLLAVAPSSPPRPGAGPDGLGAAGHR